MQRSSQSQPRKLAVRKRSGQLALGLGEPRTWGGKRKNAGRKPQNGKAGVAHRVRPPLATRYPVHVTLKVVDDLPNLREMTCYRAIEQVLFAACEGEGFRVVHFCVQGNHVHLMVEAKGAEALSRGMQGLSIRLAKALNKALCRRGRVFADRYHGRILRTPREVRNCLQYILNNTRRHRRRERFDPRWIDPCSSGSYFDGWRGRRWRPPDDEPWPVARPRTWLVSKGWRRHGLLEIAARPGPPNRLLGPSEGDLG